MIIDISGSGRLARAEGGRLTPAINY